MVPPRRLAFHPRSLFNININIYQNVEIPGTREDGSGSDEGRRSGRDGTKQGAAGKEIPDAHRDVALPGGGEEVGRVDVQSLFRHVGMASEAVGRASESEG